MLETGSPPENEEQNAQSVSPLSSLHASRSSTPGISSLDGTPRYLLAFSPPPPPPHSISHQDMAIKPAHNADFRHQEQRTKLKPIHTPGIEAEVTPDEPGQEPAAPEDAAEDDSLNPAQFLSDLTHLFRLEKYQSRKCRQIQNQLRHVHVVAAKTARLIHTARSVQRTLAECIRLEDKHSFVNLFNALQDALSDCSDASKDPTETDWTKDEHCIQYPVSFVDTLPTSSRTAILDFISRIRHDGDFVADRLAALTHREVVSLLPGKGQSRSHESVFGSSPRTSSRSSRHLGFIADGQTELLSSLEYGSPLETLVYSVRGISKLSLMDDRVATDLWATVCARLILEQKSGSEKLVPAVIDIWASSSSWPGRERLNLWISQALQNGSFLLDQPSKQSFRLRVQGRQESSADDDIRQEEFYTNTVNSLLDLLGGPDDPSFVPEGAVKLCQAICRKLQCSPSHQEAFPNFVLTRWLFSSFLPDAIALPEAHGLLTDHFMPDLARQRLLREVASRTQKSVFDVVYSWKYGNIASPDTTQRVRSVADQFQSTHLGVDETVLGAFRDKARRSNEKSFLPMSISDITTLVNALYPQRRPTSFSSDRDPSQAGVQSSASSISGFSLFQSPGTVEPGYRAAALWSQDLLPHTIPEPAPRTSADQRSFLEPGDTHLSSEFDGEQLREACTATDDVFTGGPSGKNNWCVLIANAGNQSVCTVRDGLFEVSSHIAARCASIGSASEGGNHQVCKVAIEDLLLGEELVSPHDPGFLAEREAGIELVSYFLRAFDKRISIFQQNANFVAAHAWFRKVRCFHALVVNGSRPGNLLSILRDIHQNTTRSLSRAQSLTESCDAWLRSTMPRLDLYNRELLLRAEVAGRLRDKMWYVADVRTSGVYDDARSVVSALKVMGKLKRIARARLSPPLRHWSAPKMSSTTSHLKTEAQVLEILSASPEYGGPNKLSDDQSKALSIWMEKTAVENLCRGEERLQKLCMEVRKAVDQLTVESSPLLSSTLLARDNRPGTLQSRDSAGNPFWSLQAEAGRFDLLILQTNIPPSIDSMSSASSHPLSARSSRDYLDFRSPTLATKSSAPFWSPVLTEARSPSSATSIGSSQTHAAPVVSARQQGVAPKANNESTTEQLRQRITSLLLSDLASTVFSEGSETDRAFWTGLGGELSEKHLCGLGQSFEVGIFETSSSEDFDFAHAFETLVHRFSASSNPFVKLTCLLDIDILLAPYMAQQAQSRPYSRPQLPSRDLSLKKLKRESGVAVVDTKVDGFRRLFCNPWLRPSAIFRDLQYIAALVPSSTLESTPQGKAFWNAAVAISGLKQELRQVMVETADSIIAYQSNNRGHGRSSSTAQQQRDSATFSVPSRTPSAEDVSRYTMADAAYLLQITAKEGDAVAQRELATLYLTHPELMEHIIAPLSRPRDVFKEELESKWRKNQDPNRCDPTTMCVAHHWMSLSSKGGDALATEFLRQREEMDRLG